MEDYSDKGSRFFDVNECKVCGSKLITAVLSNVKDNVSDTIEYNGSVFKCNDCKNAFFSPMLKPQNLHQAYKGYYTQSKENLENASNASYDRFGVFKDFYSYRYRKLKIKKGILISYASSLIPFAKFYLARASRFLRVPLKDNTLTLLDVGCGRGDFLIRAKYCGYHATGIDFDPETVDIAVARGLSAVVGEIKDLPESIKYDAMTLSHVLEHVYDPRQLLKDILVRLKPGGYLYLATPNFNSAGRLAFGNDWRGLDAPRHLHLFNTVALKELLKEIGYGPVEQVYDLPQSVGIIKSSFKLKSKHSKSLLQSLKQCLLLIKYRFYHPNNLDVAVFKCYKFDAQNKVSSDIE